MLFDSKGVSPLKMGKTFRPSLKSDENFFTDEVVDSGERYHKWHSEVVVGLHHWQLTCYTSGNLWDFCVICLNPCTLFSINSIAITLY